MGESPEPAASKSDVAVHTKDLTKVYGVGETAVTALDHVTLAFHRREFTAIMGPSGSGKSTLMHTLAGLDKVSSGEVFLGETNLAKLPEKQLTLLRRDRLGFVFQSFNLVPTLTAKENICLPLSIAGNKIDEEWLGTITSRLGLTDRLDHRPAELSGGQQQRVACARAFLSRPEIIFADEPTGNLDSKSSTEVLETLREAVSDQGNTVVMVTHDAKAASYADRIVFLADGRVVQELRGASMEEILATMNSIESR